MEIRQKFINRLKEQLTSDPQAVFIFLGNIEVEENWAKESELVGLPAFSASSGQRIRNRMEELCLLFASENDYLLHKSPVPSSYWEYLQTLHVELPKVIATSVNLPDLNITENVLACPETLEKLRALAGANVYLMPFGVSKAEEALSAATGIPLAGCSSEITRKVNSKIFSRELNERLGIRQIPGATCRSLSELKHSYASLLETFGEEEKFVVKESMGVSGKGIFVVDNPKKFGSLTRLLDRKIQNANTDPLHVVVEKWVNKACDLNYQFVIGRKGDVVFDFVKEAITHKGVHQGHFIPSQLNAEQKAEITTTAQALGKALFEEGYFGVVGVDAILGADGTVYPNLEINARFNMSSYQCRLQEQFLGPADCAMAACYHLKLEKPVSFEEIRECLGPLNYDFGSGEGLIIQSFSTLNAGFSSSTSRSTGRFYALIVGKSREQVEELHRRALAQLEAIEKGGKDAIAVSDQISSV